MEKNPVIMLNKSSCELTVWCNFPSIVRAILKIYTVKRVKTAKPLTAEGSLMLTRLHALTPTHVHATCFPSPCWFQHKWQEGNGDIFIYSGFFVFCFYQYPYWIKNMLSVDGQGVVDLQVRLEKLWQRGHAGLMRWWWSPFWHRWYVC